MMPNASGSTRTAAPRFSSGVLDSLDIGFAASVHFRRRSVILDEKK